jgi:hypothetical protein
MTDPIENSTDDSALIRQQRSGDYKIASDFVGNIMTKLKLYYYKTDSASAFALLEKELVDNFDLVPEKTRETPYENGKVLSITEYYKPKIEKLASDEFIFICTQTKKEKFGERFLPTIRNILIESRDNPDDVTKNIIAWRRDRKDYRLNA